MKIYDEHILFESLENNLNFNESLYTVVSTQTNFHAFKDKCGRNKHNKTEFIGIWKDYRKNKAEYKVVVFFSEKELQKFVRNLLGSELGGKND